MAANVTSMMTILSNMRSPQGVNPVIVKLPAPPVLEGNLAPNDYLTRAQAYALNAISGPESMVIVNRYIYTGLNNGWVVEIQPSGHVRKILRMSIRSCDQTGAGEDACGRPLGLRADARGFLLVADAYNGIFKVNPGTGQFRQLVDGRHQVVNGKPIRYVNDLAVAKDGSIYFTSSSTKWKPSQMLNILFEGENSGRVLMYNPHEPLAARRVQELVSNLHYPNGVQLSPDEKFLLIGEGGRCKIHRAWIAHDSPNYGKIETFADNLPGNVDNIRLSPRGTYWVGLSRARHSNLPSVMDSYGDQPEIRKNLITLVNNKMVFDDPNFGIVIELNSQGQIIRSLQDPTGSKYTSISEVEEEKGLLFIASKSKNFIGIIDLTMLPEPSPPPADAGISLPFSVDDVDVQQLLTKVNHRLQTMDDTKVRGIVLLLVRHLYQAKMEAKKANEEVSRLRLELDYIRQHTGGVPAPGGAGGTGIHPGGSGVLNNGFPGGITDWPFGGDAGGGGGGGGPLPTTSFYDPDTTTSSVMSSTTTSTSEIVIPPDMSGSSALTGSVDGDVSGGASSVASQSPSETIARSGGAEGGAGAGGVGGGETTQAVQPATTTIMVNAASSASFEIGTSTTEAGMTTTDFVLP